MKKIMYQLFAGPAVIGAAVSAGLLTAGSAVAAPDVVGEPYSDAVAEIEQGGSTARVATRVGSTLDQADCIVINATDASFYRPMTDDVYFEPAADEVLLNLNCAGEFATATNPGPSSLSPVAREAKEAASEKAANAEEETLEEVSSPGV